MYLYSWHYGSCSDELYRLRTYKPKPDERRTIDLIPSPLQAVQISSHQISDEADSTCEGAIEPGDQPLSEKRSPTLGETDSAAGQQIASQITSEVSQQLTQATKNSSCPDMKPVDLPPDTPPPDAPPPDEVTDEQAEDESTGMIGMDDGEEVDFPLEDDEYDFEKSQVEIVHTETSLLFRSFVGSLKGDSGKVTMILSPSSSAGTRAFSIIVPFRHVLYHQQSFTHSFSYFAIRRGIKHIRCNQNFTSSQACTCAGNDRIYNPEWTAGKSAIFLINSSMLALNV